MSVQAIRDRVISMLVNVAPELAQRVAGEIGIDVPAAQPKALDAPTAPEVESSAGLSMFARPGTGKITGRRVALLVANGIDAVSLRQIHSRLAEEGAAPRFIGPRLGQVMPGTGDPINVEVTLETAPSVVWDAVVVPGDDSSLAEFGQAVEFLKDQYRHCKPILLLGGASSLASAAMLPPTLPDGSLDPGLDGMVDADPDDDDTPGLADRFVMALSKHRVFERELDPPAV